MYIYSIIENIKYFISKDKKYYEELFLVEFDNDENTKYMLILLDVFPYVNLYKNGKGVLFRVIEHLKDDVYFSDVVLLTTQNNSFGPTEISYLENRFTNMAIDIDRYIVCNSNDPNPGNVTEEKESELEDFIEYSKMVLGVLGYKIFVPLVKKESKNIKGEQNTEELYLYLSRKSKKSNKKIEAKCMRTSEGFVVLRDSMIEEIDLKAIPKTIKELRKKCIEKMKLLMVKLLKIIFLIVLLMQQHLY